MEDHQVQRVVEVLGHLGNLVTRQSVGAVDGLVLQVGPVDAVLRGRGGQEHRERVKHDLRDPIGSSLANFLTRWKNLLKNNSLKNLQPVWTS